MYRRFGVLLAAVLGVTLIAAAPATADGSRHFPTEFSLPNGWQPEGIAISGTTAYFGSRADGSIYAADLRTGKGKVLAKGPGTPSLGMKVDDRKRLWVAGGVGGDARVYDTRSGKLLATFQFATADTFVNDVVLTEKSAWFTDSRKAVLYEVPLNLKPHRTLALTGDLVVTPGAVNLNGIVTGLGGGLIVVQSNTGKLFRIDPRSGKSTEINLNGQTLTNGDGLLREGRQLYVVQNRLNKVARYTLSRDGATLAAERTDARFDVPTTVAAFGKRLYLPNARFSTPPTPETTYTVVAVERP
ncbi:SMP-30/Gluconolaconase/LRE-like region-containing protein [Lentzea albidocapillata subsp. violacea]|uniref:SMP-30/Gluconolaconase/LRE-like region-containing protein n=1 Tax=Lentzea albidocapillata subsp. violacea TaxID=128104 RepID=A0A1G9U6T8_9PSEU|nr:superoxide dismutase [Lentzea albidocapillata]SDM55562.1 SMP-30/Gluconolaconase/LRE-like region-containing protein [Lentzea albidocapillata subsp. violacea]